MGGQPSSPVLLFIGVNPKDTLRLRLEEEAKRIKQALRHREKSVTLITEGAVTDDELRLLLLQHTPRLVHLSGHGEINGFKFENEQGATALIPVDALADLFRLCGRNIECVVLNACFSNHIAEAIHRYIPYVIGMNDRIGDDAALNFTRGFYEALASDQTYQDAFAIGCNAIELKDIPESLVPTLKARPDGPSLRFFAPLSEDPLLQQYRTFVLKDLTLSSERSPVLSFGQMHIPLHFRVQTSGVGHALNWPLPEIRSEADLIALCRSVAGQQGAQLIVRGEPGAGKTSLLQRIALALALNDSGPLPLYFPIGPILKEGLFVTRWPEQRMKPSHPGIEGLADALSRLGETGQLVVLVDGADALSGDMRHDAMLVLTSLVDLWPRAVFLFVARPYTVIQIAGPSFIHVEILPLVREQQKRLLSAHLCRTQSVEGNPSVLIEEILQEIEQNPSLRWLAGTCLGLNIIAPLAEHRAALERGPLLLIGQFIRFLLTSASPSSSHRFPNPEATFAALRLLAFNLTSGAHDTSSLDQLEAFLYAPDAVAVLRQLERHAPWRDGGMRAFLQEQAEKLALLGPYEVTQDAAVPRWRFVHDAFCDALAAAELKARYTHADRREQLAALIDPVCATASSWYEPVTLLVADADEPDELAVHLSAVNPALGMRLLQRVPHLSAPTIFALLGARGDWQQRGQVFGRVSELLDDARRAVELLDRIRRNTRDGNDLFFVDQALAHIASNSPELSDLVAVHRRDLFSHIPRPAKPWIIDTPAGRVPLFCTIPPGEVARAPGSTFPQIGRLRAVRGYQLSCVPITRGLISAFDPARGPSSWRPNHPAVSVTWYEATMFCRWLGTVDAAWADARLPREAEWEYACLHGANGQPFICGDADELHRVAWYRDTAADQLRPIARLQPSVLGLYDLHGNVREWCEDLWEPLPIEMSEVLDVDPLAPPRFDPTEGFRGLRGGCYLDEADVLRIGARTQAAASLASELFGFRVLLPHVPSMGRSDTDVGGPLPPPRRTKR